MTVQEDAELDEKREVDRCHALGLHPLRSPMGDDHHVNAPLTSDDIERGEALAWFLGCLFCDLSRGALYETVTPVDQWSRIARALRIHGLAIVDARDAQ